MPFPFGAQAPEGEGARSLLRRDRKKCDTRRRMSSFALDPQLDADTIPIGRLALSRVLLMNDARYPWLILVPERAGLAEIIDLPEADRMTLMREIAAASEALKALYNPDKLNVGALGNRVRQLHVHVIARFVSDAAWAGPVWGVGQSAPYPPHMAGVTADRIAGALAPFGLRDIA
jgi:diadenosine tetraphosphate (Ap4A) HIT family hydrolase